ncbi:MAG: hypothetical protein NZ739_07635, partial [Verrucomicrobiae bacterium]|nr:hypothetical protein [Verrucomicrobiae bacterium]
MSLERLQPVHVEAVPESGTFWLLQKREPPWPCLPPIAREFELPVYMLDKRGTFVVDDRSVDYAALAELETALRAAERELGLRSQTADGPPTPGDAGQLEPAGSGAGGSPMWLYGGLCLLPPVVISSDSVSLTVTNAEPGAAYDL